MAYLGLSETRFEFPKQTSFYKGKVRDVYGFDDLLVMITTDRISAFDVILPKPIPYKGQVLNQIAFQFLKATEDIVPNWAVAMPDPQVTVGLSCNPFPVEMVIRGYLSGHAWREYSLGKRQICGVELPDGLVESQILPQPIITPTTKAHEGHDLDISREEILKQGLVSEQDYIALEKYTYSLFQRGTEMAAQRGLILVDTKYEFGKKGQTIYLIDEVHTPDSSRYFYQEGYSERLKKGEAQKQLSKEFVRQWLIENDFQGKEGQSVPEMNAERVQLISDRYMELYKQVTGEEFLKGDPEHITERINKNILQYLNR